MSHCGRRHRRTNDIQLVVQIYLHKYLSLWYCICMNTETITLIEQRKSCRAFKKEEVSKEVLDQLKYLTLRAPSAGNMELYSIIEVTDNKI